jgi:hypothetical protein
MENQLRVFESLIKPFPSTGKNQVEPVVQYKPAPSKPDTLEKNSKETIEKNMGDMILPNDRATKRKARIEQATKIPDYIYNGLKGDPDSNFFEYLQLGKVPYYVGGLTLIGMFAAGISRIDGKARSEAIKKTKRIALGVAFYYLGSSLAQLVINAPVKWFRGIDLNHPYRDVVDLREGSPLNLPQNKKKEIHKVYESIDFTRWDLLFNHSAKTPEEVDKTFDKIAGKYGVKGHVHHSHSTLKDKIRETIIMSRAWKYALTVPFVVLGIGLSSQKAWENYGKGLRQDIKGILAQRTVSKEIRAAARANGGRIPGKAVQIFDALVTKLATPVKNAFVQLWTGEGKTKIAGILGKTVILTAVLGTIFANACILLKTHINDKKIVKKEKKVKING